MRILTAFALALTFAVPEAAAERIQIRSFGGSKRMAKQVRSYVVKVVKKGNKLVSRDYDGVIKGKIKKRGSSYKVYLRLYDREGEVTKKFAFRISRKGMSSKQRRLLRKKLLAAIDRLPSEPAPEEDDFAEDEGELPEEIDEGDGDDDDDDEVADAGDSDGDSEARVSKSSSEAPAGDVPRGHLHAGLSVIRRSFTFGGDIGNYNGTPAGGASLDAAVYPFTFSKKARGWKRDVAVGLAFDRSVGLKSRFEGGEAAELATTQSRLAVDARYRKRFGDEPRAFTLVGAVGVERLSFAIDRSNAPAGVTIMVPNTAYTSLIPGVELWYPINGKIALLGSAHYKLLVGAGEIVDQTQYGAGKGSGFDIAAGAEYLLTESISLRGGVQYDSVKITFEETGDLSSMGEFAQSSDSYLGGFVTAGFKL